jgi:hypothetical protein
MPGLIRQETKLMGAEEEVPAEAEEGELRYESIPGTVPTFGEVRAILKNSDPKIATGPPVVELKDTGR